MEADREAVDSLIDLFAASAARLGEVDADIRGELTEYRRGEVLFAAAEPMAAELRLHPEIAESARRTPSTSASKRGTEWVRFAPSQLDRHALDRAEAWFVSAWRAAAKRAQR
jgi:hypothetical protein